MRKMMIGIAPISPEDTCIDPLAIALDVLECYKKGASIVHLTDPGQNERLVSGSSALHETVELIREVCDIVIEIPVGGESGIPFEERCRSCNAGLAELVALTIPNDSERYNIITKNETAYCASKIKAEKKMLYLQAEDLEKIHSACELDYRFHFPKPVMFDLVFGQPGKMPSTEASLRHMIKYLRECFPDQEEVLWGFAQTDRRRWDMMKAAIEMGASGLRVGFQDSCYLNSGRKAANNYEIVTELSQILKYREIEPMSPDEIREQIQTPLYSKFS